jgi:DNA polymerase (family 10)
MDNTEIAAKLEQVADLLELQDASVFRVRAYRGAARVVAALASPAASLPEKGPGALEELPGIGKDLAAKIRELGESGELALLHELLEKTPESLIELLKIPGLGPKRAKAIHDGLGVDTLADLEKAAREGRLRTLKGVGPKLEKQILEGIAARALRGQRIPLADAEAQIAPIVERLRGAPGLLSLEVAGSFRRRKDTVGDVDILIAAEPGAAVGKLLVTHPSVSAVLADGDTKSSVVLASGLQVDLRVVAPESFGAAMHYFTGSKAHNIAVRTLGVRNKLKINEYGVFSGEERVGGEREEDVFKAVGLAFIPPELREDRGEIEAAKKGELPRLLEHAEVHGDLGVELAEGVTDEDLAALLKACHHRKRTWVVVFGPEAMMQPGGAELRARFLAQLDRARKHAHGLEVVAGGAVAIAEDGTLEADAKAFEEIAVVRGEVRTAFDQPEAALTRRLCAAVESGRLQLLARPTVALGAGKPASFAADAVAKAAAPRGVLLEIDARPERLAGADSFARAVKEAGAQVGIASRARRPHEAEILRWGIDQARRGWCEAKDVANTRRHLR